MTKRIVSLYIIQGIITKKEIINYIVSQNCFGKYKYVKEKRVIIFDDKVKLFVSSAIPEFIQYLINTSILSNIELKLWSQYVKIESIEIIEEPEITDKCHIYTLSPITVYSTLQNEFHKKTYYYNPKEPEFYNLIKRNIIKKYIALYRRRTKK